MHRQKTDYGMSTFSLSGCNAGAGHNGSFDFPLGGKLSPQVTDEGEICGDSQFARRGEVTPPYGAIKIHRAVGAGYAPPATKWQREHYGSSVGAVIDRPRSHTKNAMVRANRTGEQCSPLQPDRQICGNRQIPRRREVGLV